MGHEYLETYLNDHLAGSMGALDLLKHLEAAGTNMKAEFVELRADIEADQQELKALMGHVKVKESRSRQIGGWLAEKLGQFKLKLDDPNGPLHLLESLEAVALGIEGKLALWQALSTAAEVSPSLRVIGYEHLVKRAIEQRQRVESLRLQTAKAALGDSS